MRRAWSAIALLGALALARPAHAQNVVDQAKHLFEAGAQYYTNGQYAAAIQAFDAANKLLPKPAIEFSLAQAHRRQYFLDKNPEHLTAAIRLYKGYVVEGGARVADAAQALEELQTIANKLSAEDRAQAARAPTKEPPRIMIMSQTPGARVVLDKTPAKAVPFGPDVTAGKHHVRVFAPGFFDYDQDVQAFDGTVTPVNADLREKAAQLLLSSPPNAAVSIDGRFAGTTPLAAALAIPAGRHLVVVTKNGRQAFVRDIELHRDERKTLTVEMGVTGQRVVAESLFVGAAVAVVAGGAFTGVALVQQGKATDVSDRRGSTLFTEQDAADFESHKSARDRWATAAGIAYGVGAASLLTGVVLYVFDQPTVSPPTDHFDDTPAKPRENQRPSTEPLELGLAPAVGPSLAGLTVVGRF